MATVNLQNVTYKYPLTDNPVLKNVNLQVESGEFIAIIGPNGAGKSTLCYLLAGFVPHFYKGKLTGTVEVAGIETQNSSLSEWVLNVGLAFQNPFNQISGAKYTVFEEVAFGLENIGVEEGRVQFTWVSASEGGKFAEVINTVTETVRTLGPAKRLVRK